jgi:hypothetical protein
MACGDLIRSSVLDCENILQGGVGGDSRLILILKSHISSVTKDGFGKVTAITLVAGASAFSVDGIKQSLKPKFERQAAPTGQTLYKHTADFFYFEYSQLAKNNIARMGNGRYVAIYQNAKQDEDAFEVLGLDAGIEMSELLRAPQENGGAVKIVLTSAENEFESKPPPTMLVTDYPGTVSYLATLLALPTLTDVSPLAAAAAGGTALTLTGTNFYGGGTNDAVVKVEYVNNTTKAIVEETGFVTASNLSITIAASVAMAAGSYQVRVTTIKGQVQGTQNLIVS